MKRGEHRHCTRGAPLAAPGDVPAVSEAQGGWEGARGTHAKLKELVGLERRSSAGCEGWVSKAKEEPGGGSASNVPR